MRLGFKPIARSSAGARGSHVGVAWRLHMEAVWGHIEPVWGSHGVVWGSHGVVWDHMEAV